MRKNFKLCISNLVAAALTICSINMSTEVLASSYNSSNNVTEHSDLSYGREMRGTWVASVHNLHMPSGLDENEFRQWADELTTDIANLNFNTILFQVRPMGDALYNSELAPTSHFINGGNQGDPIGYDPLQIIIELSHSKGLEFHAWLNPYRITTPSVTLANLYPTNVAVQNPEWVININNQNILNPGIPEVQQHIVDVVMEIVNNYDIDAIHFDDYFYLSGITDEDLNTYETYGGDFLNIEDWRRDNVNTLIESVYYNIKESKPWVQFGVSPFGIWRNSSTDPTGSDTSGTQSYDAMFADSREWITRGVIDYITPQIYWSTELEVARYDILNEWWGNQIELYANTRPVNLYVGTADYKINNNFDTAWENPMQLPMQLELNRENPNIQGQMHYAVIHLFQNELGYMDIIQDEFYNTIALTPSVYWNNPTIPSAPSEVTATNTVEGVELIINTTDDNTRRFVIYRFNLGEIMNFTNENILGVVFNNNSSTFIDASAEEGKSYMYVVKSISPTGVISTEYTYAINN